MSICTITDNSRIAWFTRAKSIVRITLNLHFESLFWVAYTTYKCGAHKFWAALNSNPHRLTSITTFWEQPPKANETKRTTFFCTELTVYNVLDSLIVLIRVHQLHWFFLVLDAFSKTCQLGLMKLFGSIWKSTK